MDSRQVYSEMDIGTDKVAWADRKAVPHHGLDMVRPDQRYSAGQFARDVRGWVEQIEGRGALPVLVGGTGFFLRAVTDPIFQEPAIDEGRLHTLRRYMRNQPLDKLTSFVTALDPERATVAIQGGPQRMSRTVEVALLTGVPLSQWHREAPQEAEGLSGIVVVLNLPRDELYRRIDDRVGRMVERGLIAEVQGLVSSGYENGDPGMSGTGYREISMHLRGETTIDEAIQDVRRNTRRYARRQLTWFRNQLPASATWIDATTPLHEQVDQAVHALANAGIRTRPSDCE